jgi:hypothetical protein
MRATYKHFGVAGSIEGRPDKCIPVLEEMYREGEFVACNLTGNKREIGELAELDKTSNVLGQFAICLDETLKPTFNSQLGIASVATYIPVTEDKEMILNQPHRGFQMEHEETASHRLGGREAPLDIPGLFDQIEDTPQMFEPTGPNLNDRSELNELDILAINWAEPVEDVGPVHNAADAEALDITEMAW